MSGFVLRKVPARAHFLICYAPGGSLARERCSSGQSAFPDLLRSVFGDIQLLYSSGQSAFPDLLRSQGLLQGNVQ